MTEQPERLVLDYVSRVGEAAYGAIPSRRRVAFLAEVRTRVDEACAAAGARSAGEVRRVLRGFGAPEDVVEAELSARAGEAGGPGGGGPDGEGAGAPNGRVYRRRDPPPWRGGPETGWLGSQAGTGRAVAVGPERGSPIVTTRSRSTAGRAAGTVGALLAHPAELTALLLHLAGAVLAAAAPLWPVAAVMVGLSRVWRRRDKWVLVGGPVAATAVGMALWPGEAPYVDQYLLGSLAETGLIGLRAALAGCAGYMLLRIGKAAGKAAAEKAENGVMDR
ncbi:hypothetical protein [Nocardiopsis potens]|uniref:hypothetical protein n=1 Tax=Nocardiopsis potens TaxID=1246458 RepID=UPI00034C3E79|nr:hypothetical protein [Nocardiopsis potens]